ncbi:MAG: ferrous iron transporter B [Pirellulales bacterium]|nr:ferrous iron transporter B [Pirellulales bacterium]
MSSSDRSPRPCEDAPTSLPDSSRPVVNVALVGNPNTGKSTLFSALVGVQQRVGNYPGVTVEKKTGRFTTETQCYHLVDLPGLYSLAPRGRDEMVVIEVLLGHMTQMPPIDMVICIVDGSNLERNLYLAGQVLELGLPTVVVVNKLDVAESHGISVNLEQLRRRLPVPVVATQANRRRGIDELKQSLDRLDPGTRREPKSVFPEILENEVALLSESIENLEGCRGCRLSPRWLARRLLLDANGFLEATLLGACPGHGGPCGRGRGWGNGCGYGRGWGWRGGRQVNLPGGPAAAELRTQLLDARRRLIDAGCPLPGIETEARHAWTKTILDGVSSPPAQYQSTPSDRLDHVLTHPVWGLLIFGLLMFVVFQAVFTAAIPIMNLITTAVERLGIALTAALAGTNLAGGAVESLLVRGVLGGVGGVLVFLPQILILFFFIALLEQCGYMARAAFLMDKLMARVGLNGQSFIPLLCSFACAVPGIMATRVISDHRSRLTTMLIAPLMTCSARLPIYTLLIAAFVPSHDLLGVINLQGLTLLALYVFGTVVAIVVAWVLKRTMLRGSATPLLMEMPPYEWPSARAVLMRVAERGWIFVRTAGTVILGVSIVVWAALYYPRPAEIEAPFAPRRETLQLSLDQLPPNAAARARLKTDLAQVNAQIDAAYQRQSILARLGRAIEPVVRPLGWDWRIGSAVLASFPQREAVVATLGVIFGAGQTGEPADAASLAGHLRNATWERTDRPLFTLPVALSLMVFYALCAQCAATLAVIGRESGGWRWPLFTFGYLTTLAYLGALVTYQFGTWLAG